MIPVESLRRFGPVVVVSPSPGRAGYRAFYQSMKTLRCPPASADTEAVGASVARNCNEGIAAALADSRTSAFFFVDDDHEVPPDRLERLLLRDVPIVVGLTCRKYPPFLPALYKARNDKNLPAGTWTPYDWPDLAGKTGLLEVAACGRAGLLVRREVFEKLGPPWFRLGQLDPQECQEDLDFCVRATALGYSIYCDLDAPFGHIDAVAVAPERQADGQWGHRLRWWGGLSLPVSPRPVPDGQPKVL